MFLGTRIIFIQWPKQVDIRPIIPSKLQSQYHSIPRSSAEKFTTNLKVENKGIIIQLCYDKISWHESNCQKRIFFPPDAWQYWVNSSLISSAFTFRHCKHIIFCCSEAYESKILRHSLKYTNKCAEKSGEKKSWGFVSMAFFFPQNNIYLWQNLPVHL